MERSTLLSPKVEKDTAVLICDIQQRFESLLLNFDQLVSGAVLLVCSGIHHVQSNRMV